MNSILQEAFAAIQQLPEERQKEIAETLLGAAMPSIEYSDEQIASVEAAIADDKAGRYAIPTRIALLLDQ